MTVIKTFEHKGKHVEIHNDSDPVNPFEDYDQCHEWYIKHPRNHIVVSDGFECPTLTRKQIKNNLPDIVAAFATVEFHNLFGKMNEQQGTLLKGLSVTIDRSVYDDVVDYINDCINECWQYEYLDHDTVLTWAEHVVVSGTHTGYNQGDWFEYVAFLTPETIKDQGIGKPEEYLTATMQEYRNYVFGDVWGYVIKDSDDQEVDSCWGFSAEYCTPAWNEFVQEVRDTC